jgi:hypothetical protein
VYTVKVESRIAGGASGIAEGDKVKKKGPVSSETEPSLSHTACCVTPDEFRSRRTYKLLNGSDARRARPGGRIRISH